MTSKYSAHVLFVYMYLYPQIDLYGQNYVNTPIMLNVFE